MATTRPLTTTSSSQIPIEIRTRVFPGDDRRFRFRVEWWFGDVDTRNTPATDFYESPRSYTEREDALAVAAIFAGKLGAPKTK